MLIWNQELRILSPRVQVGRNVRLTSPNIWIGQRIFPHVHNPSNETLSYEVKSQCIGPRKIPSFRRLIISSLCIPRSLTRQTPERNF